MPKLYQGNSQLSGFVNNRASAEDFGSGIGVGLQQVGEAMRVVENNQSVTEANTLFHEMKRQNEEQAEAEYGELSGHTKDFADRRLSSLDNLGKQYRDQLKDDRSREIFDKNLEQYKTNHYIAEIGRQSTHNTKHSVAEVTRFQDVGVNQVLNNPANYPSAIAAKDDFLAQMILPEPMKKQLSDSWDDSLAYTHGLSVMMQRDDDDVGSVIDRASDLRKRLLKGELDGVLYPDSKIKLLDKADTLINSLNSINRSEASEFTKNAIAQNNDGMTPDGGGVSDDDFRQQAMIASNGKQSEYRDLLTDFEASKMVNNYKRNTKFVPIDDREYYREQFRKNIEKTDKTDIVDYESKIKAYNTVLEYDKTRDKQLRADPRTFVADHPAVQDAERMAQETGDTSQLIRTIRGVQMGLGLNEHEVRYMTTKQADDYVADLSVMSVQDAYAQLRQSQEEWGNAWPSVKGQLKGLPGWATVVTSMPSDRAAEAYISSIKNGDTIEVLSKNMSDVDKTSFNTKLNEAITPYADAFKHSPAKFMPYRNAIEHLALRHYNNGGDMDAAISYAAKQVFGLSNVVEGSIMQGDLGRVLAPATLNDKPYEAADAAKHLSRLRELLAQSPTILLDLERNPDKWGDAVTANALDLAPLPTFDFPMEYKGLDPDRAAGLFYDNIKQTGEFINVMGGVALSYTTDSGARDFLSTAKRMPDGSVSREPVVFSWDDISGIGGASLPLKHYGKVSAKWRRGGEIAKRAIENIEVLGIYHSGVKSNKQPPSASEPQQQPAVEQPASGQNASEFDLERVLNDVKSHEGVSFTPEQIVRADGSVEDFYTGGYGHRMTDAEAKQWMGKQIPKEVMDRWWKEDTKKAVDAARKQMKEIGVNDQNLFDALVNMNYQLGTEWYKEHDQTWDMLKNKKFGNAAGEVYDSLWYRQTPNRVNYVSDKFRKVAG